MSLAYLADTTVPDENDLKKLFAHCVFVCKAVESVSCFG
jgi:hypothetical protein